jgi:hypothetical protein
MHNDFANDMLEYCQNMNRIMSQELEMAAIWFDRPITFPDGRRSARVTIGDHITVEGGKVVSSAPGSATHRVIRCFGTVNSSRLCFDTIRLADNQPEIINIK